MDITGIICLELKSRGQKADVRGVEIEDGKENKKKKYKKVKKWPACCGELHSWVVDDPRNACTR